MVNYSRGADISEFGAGGDGQDELFEVLSDSSRRFALRLLQRAEGRVPVAELASATAAWDGRRPVSERSNGSTEDVQLALVHSHLPKMADAGLVDYDDDGQTVALSDDDGAARAHLRVASD